MGPFFLYIYNVNQKFPKQEKLKSSKTIAKLFLEGKTYTKYPLKMFYLPSENTEINAAAFAVPKRNFKSAVVRNRIKRQLREAYRLNKQTLGDIHGKKFVMLFLFIGKKNPTYDQLEKTMVKLLKNLLDENS